MGDVDLGAFGWGNLWLRKPQLGLENFRVCFSIFLVIGEEIVLSQIKKGFMIN